MTRGSFFRTGIALAAAMASSGPVMAADASGGSATAASPAIMPPRNAWPAIARPAAGAPNVLLIMTDDVGFGASSPFGGPIETPVFAALAQEGLRYTNMTTTGICSPTRAALLTGRNHNAVNVGNVIDAATNFDGFTSVIPKSAATGARLLTDAGYNTAMFGKGHITPSWELGPGGPFDRWPTGLGFQHFYGFLTGDTNQWAPALFEGNHAVDPPANDPDYILDRDLADHAVGWMRTQCAAAPGKPFFVYYAPGTAHAPHHAPAEWVARYKGRFDAGWDVIRAQTLARQKQLGIVPKDTKLAARADGIPAWDSLTAQQKLVYAHEMEVYAAALSFADHEIGRVVDEARKLSGGNLMVVFVQGDNGASAEAGIDGTLNEHAVISGFNEGLPTIAAHMDDMGGPNALNHYSIGWAGAMNTPFPYFKQLASHYGATRNGVVIDWPGHTGTPGGIRPQFHHVTDIMPTILAAAKVSLPDSVDGVRQQPFDGIDMSYSFNAPAAPSRRQTQYYALWDNMAIYHDGWVAASLPEIMPWEFGAKIIRPTHIAGRQWQLYDVRRDFSQTTDLAARYPERLAELKQLFNEEAGRNRALPVHRFEGFQGRPDPLAGINHFHYAGPVSRIFVDAAPPLIGRSFTLAADIAVPAGGGDGTIMAFGGRFGGLALYVRDGKPSFEYNFAHVESTVAAAPAQLTAGAHRIEVRFERSPGFIAPGKATLRVDGATVAEVAIPRTNGSRMTLDESFDIGRDSGTPVSASYRTPNLFSGTISSVDLDIDPQEKRSPF